MVVFALSLGDVLLHRNVVRRDAPGPLNGGYRSKLPEKLAAFLLVYEFAPPDIPSLQSPPHALVKLIRAFPRLQDEGPATDFVQSVAGHFGELRIDVLDLAVSIGYYD